MPVGSLKRLKNPLGEKRRRNFGGFFTLLVPRYVHNDVENSVALRLPQDKGRWINAKDVHK